ncbi:MAG: asparaginase [Coleofasciculaceae cyanobacterium SM2_1_6]|nr:asparaginase [Coleofasciculaceae cyanobacterium SM2_1_6]
MSRGKRNQSLALEVRLLREGIIESVHHVQAVVADERGRVLSTAGNPETATFIGAALSPFQAIAATTSGTLERYGLSDRDLAIICSTHQGTTEQCRQVFKILWRCDLDPDALQCVLAPPSKAQLQHESSGRHAGMLAVCQQLHFPLHNYLHRNHPIQKLILTKVAELLKMPGEEIIGAQDNCGAPTYFMQLGQMASLYAQLASGANLDLERVIRAMTHHPNLVAGVGEFDTELMQLTDGEIVSKSGSEGIQCIGRIGEGMGLAIKGMDGSKRAKQAVAIHLLRHLGWISPSVAESLGEKFMKLGTIQRLDVQGELSLS